MPTSARTCATIVPANQRSRGAIFFVGARASRVRAASAASHGGYDGFGGRLYRCTQSLSWRRGAANEVASGSRGRELRIDGLSTASGGELFTAEKFPKRAGGCGPRTPMGLRGVHPRKRHFVGRYAPPGRPVPYCLPLPGFARASGKRPAVTATEVFSKAARTAPEQGLDFAHGSFFA